MCIRSLRSTQTVHSIAQADEKRFLTEIVKVCDNEIGYFLWNTSIGLYAIKFNVGSKISYFELKFTCTNGLLFLKKNEFAITAIMAENGLVKWRTQTK